MGIKSEDYDLVGSYNNQRIAEIDSERTINCFEYRDINGKKPKALIGTSGLINQGFVFTSAGIAEGFRGQFTFLTNTYMAIGAHFYKIAPDNTVALLYSTLDGTGYVGIDGNEFQLIVVDGRYGYVYDTTYPAATMIKITDPAFPVLPIDVCMLDEFAVVANGQTNNFELSMFNQALIWGPDNVGVLSTFAMAAGSPQIVITYAPGGTIANYQVGSPIIFSGGSHPAELTVGIPYYVVAIISGTTIEVSATQGGTPITSTAGGTGSLTNKGQLQLGSITTHAGTIVACRTLHRRLFLFSQNFTEVWENAGVGENLPFRRNNSALMEFGTPAIGSIAVSFDKMFFLSQSVKGIGPVMQVEGTQAVPVSNRALDLQLAQYSALQQVSDCSGFLIQEKGLIFYRMNFTAANHTFVYDVTLSNPLGDDSEKLWHEEEDIYGNRHWTQTSAYFNGNNYAGSYNKPILYLVSETAYSNDGQNIHRTRISGPTMNPGSNRRRVDRLFIDMLQGNRALAVIPVLKNTFAAISGSSPSLVLTSGSAFDYPVGTQINFSIIAGATLPTASPALAAGQIYYVTTIVDSTTINISATSGGTAINFTTTGTAGIYIQNAINNSAVTPHVYLSISKDGGQSYTMTQQLPFGAIGQRTFRTLARKIGIVPRVQAFLCKVEFYAQVPFYILGASWVNEILPE